MSNTRTQELQQNDRNTVFHPSTNAKDHAAGVSPSRVIDGGEGIFIRDAEGVQLLDGFAGLYCVNIGYGRQEMAEAIYEQAKKLSYYHSYAGHSTEPLIELSQKIIDWAPDGMSKVYYGLSGSDANETQIKLVRYYNNVLGRPAKKKIISRNRGYHGSSIAAGSLTGLPLFHDHFDLPLDFVKHTIAPHHYWNAPEGMDEREFSAFCATELEKMIQAEGPDTVAAFIGEPVMGTGGLIPPPEGYWKAIQTVLDRYDILLIADEVITGFGRLGSKFGSHHYDMKPDLISIAKGLTSAYLPLSGVIVGDKVWKTIEDGAEKFGPIGHGWTYSGHTLSVAAALENLKILEKENLVGNAAKVGAYLQQRLHETFGNHEYVGEVRGEGLMAALEFVADRNTKRRFPTDAKIGYQVTGACLKQNLIVRAMPNGDILGISPPLVISETQVDDMVGRIKTAVDQLASAFSSAAKP